jgi:Protein of unknown function (DUF1360)
MITCNHQLISVYCPEHCRFRQFKKFYPRRGSLLDLPHSNGFVMNASQFIVRFVIAALATWRVTHLLASEDGPGDIVLRARALLASSVVGGLIDCFACLSIWVAIPFVFFVASGLVELIVTWLALSGAAFLLERMSPEPLVVERIPDNAEGDQADGMLRPATDIAQPNSRRATGEPPGGERQSAVR